MQEIKMLSIKKSVDMGLWMLSISIVIIEWLFGERST